MDEITTAISDVRAAAQTENVEDINSKIDALQKSVMKIGEELSRQSGGSGGSDANANADAGAQDAEYTKAEEDKEKKE